jgi:hypothetical protein
LLEDSRVNSYRQVLEAGHGDLAYHADASVGDERFPIGIKWQVIPVRVTSSLGPAQWQSDPKTAGPRTCCVGNRLSLVQVSVCIVAPVTRSNTTALVRRRRPSKLPRPSRLRRQWRHSGRKAAKRP